MQMKPRKLWPIFGLMCLSVFATTSLHSHGNNSQSNSTSSSQETYERGTYREITPNAGPRVAHGADVFITADFIWWKAVQEGTRYATTGIAPGSMATTDELVSVPRGNTRSVGRDWAPGFKVGLGLNLNHDGWDIYTQYTWLHPRNHNRITREIDPVTGFGVVSKQTPNTLQGPYGDDHNHDCYRWDRASAHWSLHFNVLDLELGRHFYLSQFLSMRPFIGLKGTWQDQHIHTRLFHSEGVDAGFVTPPQDTEPTPQPLSSNGLESGDVLTLSGPYDIHQHNDVWGIGVRGGFNLSWYLTKDWSIYGDLAWTTMWADYTDLRRRDKIKNKHRILNDISPTMVNIKEDNHYSVKYIGELELGLRWEIWFYDDNYHFAVQAGWEQQVWLNWNTVHSLIEPDHWDDLNFHGLNLKFRFDF